MAASIAAGCVTTSAERAGQLHHNQAHRPPATRSDAAPGPLAPQRADPAAPRAGLGAAALLMLVARPLSVLCFQPFSPFPWRQSLLIAWCGMRGAVPLALSFNILQAIPRLQGMPAGSAQALAHNAQSIVFIVVILNLLLQGLSLPPLCRWLNGRAEPVSSS